MEKMMNAYMSYTAQRVQLIYDDTHKSQYVQLISRNPNVYHLVHTLPSATSTMILNQQATYQHSQDAMHH